MMIKHKDFFLFPWIETSAPNIPIRSDLANLALSLDLATTEIDRNSGISKTKRGEHVPTVPTSSQGNGSEKWAVKNCLDPFSPRDLG